MTRAEAVRLAVEFACEGERDLFSPDFVSRFLSQLARYGYLVVGRRVK